MKNKRFLVILGNICLILVLALVITAMPAFSATPATPAPSPAKPIKLVFGTWGGQQEAWAGAAKAWGKEVTEKSGGRVTVEYLWGGTLGKAPAYYDTVLGGLCDVSNIGPTWTTGRFPMVEIMGLPIMAPTTVIASKALWKFYKMGYLDKEFAKVKVLFTYATGVRVFQWAKSPATTFADFKGKKVRSSGGLNTDELKAIGATPVSLSVGEVYLALKSGVADGNFGAWSAMIDYKLHEITKYATETNWSFFPLIGVMNKDSWNKLPKDIQSMIENIGEKYSVLSGQGFDDHHAAGKKLFIDAGGRADVLSAAETEKMGQSLKPIWDAWISQMEAKGYPAKKAVADLYNILKELGVEKPYVR